MATQATDSVELANIEKHLKQYDTNNDGSLNADEFKAAFADWFGFTDNPDFPWETIFKELAHETHKQYGNPTEDKITLKSIANLASVWHQKDYKKLPFAGLRSLGEKLKAEESQKHHIGTSFGETEHSKTAFDLKVFFSDEKDPSGVKTKLEELVSTGFQMVGGFIPFPLNLEQVIKVEYHVQEGHALTIGIHFEHKALAFALSILGVNLETTLIEKVKAYVHFRGSAKGSLEDLANNASFGGDLSKVINEGFAVNLDVHTNADEYIKSALDLLCGGAEGAGCCSGSGKECKLACGFAKVFLTNGSSIHLGADEFKVLKKPLKVLEAGSPVYAVLSQLKGTLEGLKQMGIPPLDILLDIIENSLDANVHISLNTPHIFTTLHIKTPGLKAALDKIQV